MTARVVIGANWGDEGKGVAVDAHAARAIATGRRVWCVRFNSSAQAGHTVTTPDGRRHVFAHWGSGALAGAGTHLGPRFAVHPMLWAQETEALRALGAHLALRIDPRCPWVTPWDVMLNQAVERARGEGRHGSCGVGFGEAIARTETPGFALKVRDASDPAAFRRRLLAVRDDHVPQRLAALGLQRADLGPFVDHDGVIERYLDQVAALLEHATLADPSALANGDALVFEGAQGLALDEDLGAFPHVTRSKTGLPFAIELAEEAGLAELKVDYLTRAYATRHGAGPLPHERGGPPTDRVVDATNRPNAHQGALRFGALDLEGLAHRVAADRARTASSPVAIEHGVVVSCLDQMGVRTDLVGPGGEERVATSELPDRIAQAIGASWAVASRGPTRRTWDREPIVTLRA